MLLQNMLLNLWRSVSFVHVWINVALHCSSRQSKMAISDVLVQKPKTCHFYCAMHDLVIAFAEIRKKVLSELLFSYFFWNSFYCKARSHGKSKFVVILSTDNVEIRRVCQVDEVYIDDNYFYCRLPPLTTRHTYSSLLYSCSARVSQCNLILIEQCWFLLPNISHEFFLTRKLLKVIFK